MILTKWHILSSKYKRKIKLCHWLSLGRSKYHKGGQYIITIYWPRGQNIVGVKISSHRGIGIPDTILSLIMEISIPGKMVSILEQGRGGVGGFKNTYELVNLWAHKFSLINKLHIFQCAGKILCVEFQRKPLKFHTKYLAHSLKETIFIQYRKFKSSQTYALLSVFETPPWSLVYNIRTGRADITYNNCDVVDFFVQYLCAVTCHHIFTDQLSHAPVVKMIGSCICVIGVIMSLWIYNTIDTGHASGLTF